MLTAQLHLLVYLVQESLKKKRKLAVFNAPASPPRNS